MIDPVGATLGAIAILGTIYDTCDRLYHGCRLTQAFGSDFAIVQLELEMQYCRLDVTSRKRVIDLETPIQVNNPDHETTKTVIKVLSLIKTQFELSHKLMKKYSSKEKGTGSISTPDDDSRTPSQSTGSASMKKTSSTLVMTPSSSIVVPEEPKKSKIQRYVTGPLHIGRGHKKAKNKASASDPVLIIPSAAQDMLMSGAVANMELVRAQEAQNHHEQTNFFRRVVWAKEDMDTLYRIIRVLKDSNNFLETVLASKPTQDPSRLVSSIETPEAIAPWLAKAKDTQGRLLRLHESLRHMNSPGNDHGVWKLAIQLAIDFNESRTDAINALYGLPLRRDAIYFNLKREVRELQNSATLIVAETVSSNAVTQSANEKDPAWYLDQPPQLATKPTEDMGDFKNWGTVWTATDPTDFHRLFHAPTQISHSSGTLTDLLRNQNATKMTPLQRTQLATLIAISYLHFHHVLQSCTDIKPSSFIYYNDPNIPDPWTADELPILTPYLSIGFGERPPPTRLGSQSGVSSRQTAIVVGLGLLLFQIGSCKTLQYDQSSRALEEAKRIVSYNLHLLDLRVSGVYAEVTEACLQYSLKTVRGGGRDGERFLEGVVERLFSLQEAF